MSRMIQILLFLLPFICVASAHSSDGGDNRVEILVIDGLGQPLEGAYVTLYSDHGRTIETTRLTAKNGKADFGVLDRESMSLSVAGLDEEYKRFDGYAIYDAPVRSLQVSLELNEVDHGFSCDKSVVMTLNIDTDVSQGWTHDVYVNSIKQRKSPGTSGDLISVCHTDTVGNKAHIVVISTNEKEPSLIRYGYANDVEIKEGGDIALNDISLRQWGSDSKDSYEHFISSYTDSLKKGDLFNSELNANPIMALNDNNELTWKVSGTQPVYTTAYFQDKNSAEYMINWEIKSPSSMATIPMPRLPDSLGQFAHTRGTQYIDIELEMTYSPDYESITQMSDLYMNWLVDGGKKPLLTEESRSVSLFSSL